MKRSARIAIGVIALAVVVGPVLAFPFYDKIVPVLGPVLPRPQGVPSDAAATYDFKEGMGWTWMRPVDRGCLSWMAVERWASVQLFVEEPCGRLNERAYSPGTGLTYFSVEDYLVFRGYWPWSADIFHKLIVFDRRGNWVHTLPCPYSLTREQIERLRGMAAASVANVSTHAEKRVVLRIAQRLAKLDGKSLSTSQVGCTDLQNSQDFRGQVDPWKAK